MKIFEYIDKWQQQRQQMDTGKTLGVVMTMGAFHKGHLSLIERSKQECDLTLVTLFVNPTQFNNQEDLVNYPSSWQQDIEFLTHAQVDFLLSPSIKDIYPDDYNYMINEKLFSKHLCGLSRAGHFNGVLTIVMKLLQISQATSAYFGKKDYQQFSLIKSMVKAFFVPTKIIGCNTLREPDGLAYSSRNRRLSISARKKAGFFAQTIKQDLPLQEIAQILTKNNIQVDYLQEHFERRFAAVVIENIRLIDNFSLTEIKQKT